MSSVSSVSSVALWLSNESPMAEDQGNKDEEKLEFTSEGEALGYIGMDQAQVRAMQIAAETPGDYGTAYAGIAMAFEVADAQETDDHYIITLSLRPQGEFDGRVGLEQFFIEKEGNVAHRQVLALPRRRRRIPLIPAAAGLVLVAAIAIGVSIGVTRGAGDDADTVVGPGSSAETAVPTETEPPESVKEPQSEPQGTSALDPLESDAGLEYVPIRYSSGLEIFGGQRVAMSFSVPADGAITGVELLNVGPRKLPGGCSPGFSAHGHCGRLSGHTSDPFGFHPTRGSGPRTQRRQD